MEIVSLTAEADRQLVLAREARSGRAAHTVRGAHDLVLRQTLIALAAGRELAEHDSPGEATLQVLRGRVRLVAGDDTVEGSAGDLLTIPPRRHALLALDDAAVLLTVADELS
ncbi:cupin domain-containing protein [Pseudonocardia parietis]|uniref:Quercetin dioxygenase-like cupin family protein n=1 Tax=Pseudonocardia parietis TaxID=570936 RepID=A0ABS4VZD6_9PSEU|nr:cupin domain-containing protein [Pseudonocardia parietis]MBP2369287.1 quercetin dioxygenase-like cupin family protein [Pseudonocardia parietis]